MYFIVLDVERIVYAWFFRANIIRSGYNHYVYLLVQCFNTKLFIAITIHAAELKWVQRELLFSGGEFHE